MKWFGESTPWLFRFVQDSRTGQPSVKRYGLAITVTVLCGVLLGLGIVMAMAAVQSSGRDQVDIVRICGDTIIWGGSALLTAVSGSYVADKALSRGKDNAQGDRDSNKNNQVG